MATHKVRAPPRVQVAFDRISTTAQLHATVASPTSKSGAFTPRRSLPREATGVLSLTGTFRGDSLMSRMSSQEADYRFLEKSNDGCLSMPMAQLREDGEYLNAVIEMQAAVRR